VRVPVTDEKAPKDKDLLNTRDNLSLAIDHDQETNKTIKAQIMNRGKLNTFIGGPQ
jgi:hypothetical protein